MAYLEKKEKNKNTPKPKKQVVLGPVTLLIIFISSALLITIFSLVAYISYTLLELPDIKGINKYNPPVVTEVYDSQGNVLAHWYVEKRWYIPIDKIPANLKKAALAAEDARFYEHKGIDFIGVLRAILKNVEAGEMVQGASTITQQVTRALLLSSEKSLTRKIKEAILAWQIDALLTKDEILTIYLNQIYFGQNAYGVEAAARAYFGKHVKDLNLSECAFIAGLPQAPSRYNLQKNRELAMNRHAHVIKRMLGEGFISSKDAEEALSYPLEMTPEVINPPTGSEYFLADIRKKLEEKYGKKVLYTSGLRIYTTLYPAWQEKANEAIKTGLNGYFKKYSKDKEKKESVHAALVSIESKTGKIRAMIGGQDFNKMQYNLATQGKMQPGSSFKPIMYSAALEKGVIHPNSIINDEPIVLPGSSLANPWIPQNYDGEFMGPITLKTAVTHSRNVPAIKVTMMTGVDSVIQMAKKMGIVSPLTPNYTIALGSNAVPVMEMVKAFSAFPNLGYTVEPVYIEYIKNNEGKFLEISEPVRNKAMEPNTAFQMLNLLQAVVQEGTGRRALKLGLPAGGKTGTTNDFKDAWFLGFTPDVVTGVWVGRIDKKSLGNKETGGGLVCPIWTDYMEITKSLTAGKTFEIPDGIALVRINLETGKLVKDNKTEGIYTTWVALPEEKALEMEADAKLKEEEMEMEAEELKSLSNLDSTSTTASPSSESQQEHPY
jgi:penicillin-binding protein 1A